MEKNKEKDEQVKPMDVLQFSERDLWISGLKVGGTVATALIFLGIIYARFISVEATQAKILLQMEKDKAEINENIKALDEQHDSDRGDMYRFVADKFKSLDDKLEDKTKRLDEATKKLDDKVDAYNLDAYKNSIKKAR